MYLCFSCLILYIRDFIHSFGVPSLRGGKHIMSKKQFRSQASSGRAAFVAGATFGASFGGSAFGSSSALSWITEPPDLSGISDPNVAVSFKNLTKKDSTTKAKALEDLQAHVSSPAQEVEETVLEAWVRSLVLIPLTI